MNEKNEEYATDGSNVRVYQHGVGGKGGVKNKDRHLVENFFHTLKNN
jgi:hypothetical protein